MTKKDYEMIARNIRHNVDHVASSFTGEKSLLEGLASDIATDLAVENPRFDRARFMKACGF